MWDAVRSGNAGIERRHDFAYALGVKSVTVVGAGLAGCEAALQCARLGVPVRLFEMRPAKMTEAHETGDVAELVCSNSLKSDEPENAHGLLKAELRVLGSVLLECAERARIPGGKALVVDRRRFSQEVQRALDAAGVEIVREEIRDCTGLRPHLGGRGLSQDFLVLATGPLTSQPLAESLQSLFAADLGHGAIQDAGTAKQGTVPRSANVELGAGQSPFCQNRNHVPRRLFFYDAIAPIVAAESLDMNLVFEGSRYGAGSDYLNCPMSEEEYGAFVDALLGAELHPLHEFEKRAENGDCTGERLTRASEGLSTIFGTASRNPELGTVPAAPERGAIRDSPQISPHFFEGCLPVEEMARRGRLVLAFGPMKPVGLVDPRGHDAIPDAGTRSESPGGIRSCPQNRGHVPRRKRPFAVVQLRRENAEGTMYNLVGFQTRLKHGEQERVFRMIPGLAKATFLRFGSIHRNTYLDSPKVLLPTLQTRVRPGLFIAGQLTGVEGYVESIGAGLVAGINAARLEMGQAPLELPREMMMGSLLAYIAGSSGHDPKSQEDLGHVPLSRVRFQPMNANFGLLPAYSGSGHDPKSREGFGHVPRLRGRDKRRAMAERALAAAREFASTIGPNRVS
jgi:methylenetetrahydrofolate--tRNA-(uracil-5-)-methyltransferase